MFSAAFSSLDCVSAKGKRNEEGLLPLHSDVYCYFSYFPLEKVFDLRVSKFLNLAQFSVLLEFQDSRVPLEFLVSCRIHGFDAVTKE